RVSVVTPAFDAAQTIGATVASVLGQTYRDLELVVVDDGSTDGTAAIAEAHGAPVRVVRQEKRGGADARNRGLEAAAGELIAFCDADDFLLPRHVERLVRVWDDHGGIATANSYLLLPGGIDRSKRRYRGGFPKPAGQRRAILEQNFVSALSVFPRALVEEIGAFDVERRRAEDWDFWLRAIFAGRRVTLQPEPTALYRWGTQSLSSAYDQMDAEVEAVLRTAAARDDLTPDERGYVERRPSRPSPRRPPRPRAARAGGGAGGLRAPRSPEAAHAYAAAARLVPSERMLLWKARVLRPAPRVTGPLVRARQLRIERSLGLTEEHVR